MSRSEIKVRRRDICSVGDVAAMLRRMAEEIEAGHTFTLDGVPVMIGNRVEVERKYKKEGNQHTFRLDMEWDEEWFDQAKVDDESDETDEDVNDLDEEDDLPDGDVRTPPLDLPGTEDMPRNMSTERGGE